MQIYINKNGQQLGPFDQPKIEEMLRFGQILPTDFAIKQGDANWTAVKNLFVQTPQNLANPSEFSNFQVVSWAKEKLAGGITVEHKFDSWLSAIFFGGILFFIPILIWILAIYLTIEKLSGRTTQNPSGAFIFAIILTALFGGIWLLIRYSKRNQATQLTSDGVEMRNGKSFAWKDLYEVTYTKANRAHTPNPIAMLISTIVVEMMFAGNQRTIITLIFANGKAVIPPLIHNQAQILSLFETIPAKVSGT